MTTIKFKTQSPSIPYQVHSENEYRKWQQERDQAVKKVKKVVDFLNKLSRI